jgi:hypothetical protein
MELVILSTLAAVVILIAELRDLVSRDHIDRSFEPAAGTRLASVVNLATGGTAANESAATQAKLGRAA